MIVMKTNASLISDEELIASFCVRTHEFNAIIQRLREHDGVSSQHKIVIGPPGSGKTMLLRRVAAELRRDPDLSNRFVPLVFSEESYGITTADEFWLETEYRLAEQVRAFEGDDDPFSSYKQLRSLREKESMLGLRCLANIAHFTENHNKCLVLIVENLDLLFRDRIEEDAGWVLRKTFQEDPNILLLASASSSFDEIDKYHRALYHFLDTKWLRELRIEECAILWEKITGQSCDPATLRGAHILTGGNPRRLVIFARHAVASPGRSLMAGLLGLVEEMTDYFKGQMEALPPQERRVYLSLAGLWKPASTREVALGVRLDTSHCSALLKRLENKRYVQVAGNGTKRRLYYPSDRLVCIYTLLRQSYRTPPALDALIRFMETYYAPHAEKEPPAKLGGVDDGLPVNTQLAGKGTAATRDTIEQVLANLSALDYLPMRVIDLLLSFMVSQGPMQTLMLVQESPAYTQLAPLAVALGKATGAPLNVATEIDEIAGDIHKDIESRLGQTGHVAP